MADLRHIATGVEQVSAIETVVDWFAVSRLRSFLAILFVGLIVFLPGSSTIGPLDRDEPRFVLATNQMIEAGGLGYANLPDSPQLMRPFGSNWLQYLAVSLVGDGTETPMWVYRLPSFVGALAVVFLTWWMALAFGRPRAAILAALLIATTPLLIAEAHLAKSDAVLLAMIVLSQGALVRIWQRKSDKPDYWLAFLFWTGLGVGILTKGVVAPLVIGLTVAVLAATERSAIWLRQLVPIPGAIWLAALVGGAFIVANMGVSALSGLPDGIAVQEMYKAPPGTYAVLFYPLFGPAGVFVALAIPGLIDRIRRRVFLFVVAWVAPFWLLVELWPEKLPYFILPAYPALALLGATAIDEGWPRVSGWISGYFSLNLVVWPVAVGAGAAALFFASEGGLPWPAVLLVGASLVVGAWSFWWFYRGTSVVGSAMLSMLSAVLLYIGLFGILLPNLSAMHISERLVAAGRGAVTCDRPEFVSTGFSEPSLVLEAGNDISLTKPDAAADFLAEGGCRVAFVEARRQSIFNQRMEDLGLELNVKDQARGGNIGNWKLVKLRVFAVDDGAN